MNIQISVVGCTYEQLAVLESSFACDSFFNASFLSFTYQEAQKIKDFKSSDFIIFYFTSLSISATGIPLDNLDISSKSICCFDKESNRSKLLESLGFKVSYAPCSPEDLIYKIKIKLSDELRSKKKSETTTSSENTLVFSSMDRYVMVEKDKLIRASSSGNYTTLFLSDQKEVTVTKQLGKVASKLPGNKFFRVHHGHVVNRTFIKTILKQNQLLVVLRNQEKVPVSRRRKKEFLTWLGLYI